MKGKGDSADVRYVKAPRALERRQQSDLYSPPFTERAHTLDRENLVVNAPKNSAQIQKEKSTSQLKVVFNCLKVLNKRGY